MASLQLRNGSWRVIFRYKGLQHFVTIGEVEEIEAQGVKARYEYLLRLLKQHLLSIPSGMDVSTVLLHDVCVERRLVGRGVEVANPKVRFATGSIKIVGL